MLNIITAIFPYAFAGNFGFYRCTTQWTSDTSAVTFQSALASKSTKEKSMSLENGSNSSPQSEESRVCETLAHKFCATVKRGEDAHMIAFTLGWQASARYALKHSPTVVQMREALEKLKIFSEQLCEDVRVSKHQPSIERAQLALAAYESEVK